MPNSRVLLTPRIVSPADPAPDEPGAGATQRLSNLGMRPGLQDGWVADIDGRQVVVAAYEVRPDDETDASLVSLVVIADRVEIGQPQPAPAPPVPDEKLQVARWGAPGQRDPRERIAGWEPEGLGEQVARNAEVQA